MQLLYLWPPFNPLYLPKRGNSFLVLSFAFFRKSKGVELNEVFNSSISLSSNGYPGEAAIRII